MKRFNELTKDQQDTAIQYAIKEMQDCIDMGFITFDAKIRASSLIVDYAIAAAENAWYSSPNDKIIADITEE